VDRLSQDPKFAKVTLFRIDFDSGKEHLRQFKVDKQSTFVAFKGTTETARSTGETDGKALQKVFESTL
jgi:thioredoxin 1